MRARPLPARRRSPLLGARLISHPPRFGPGPGVNPYDPSADATLQGILALLTEQRGSAQAGALKAREQLAID